MARPDFKQKRHAHCNFPFWASSTDQPSEVFHQGVRFAWRNLSSSSSKGVPSTTSRSFLQHGQVTLGNPFWSFCFTIIQILSSLTLNRAAINAMCGLTFIVDVNYRCCRSNRTGEFYCYPQQNSIGILAQDMIQQNGSSIELLPSLIPSQLNMPNHLNARRTCVRARLPFHNNRKGNRAYCDGVTSWRAGCVCA